MWLLFLLFTLYVISSFIADVLQVRKYVIFIKRAVLIRWLVRSSFRLPSLLTGCGSHTGVLCFLTFKGLLTQKLPAAWPGLPHDRQEWEVLLPFSWRRCRPASQPEGVPTSCRCLALRPSETVAARISSRLLSAPQSPGDAAGDRTTCTSDHSPHILPTSCLSGRETAFGDSVLPDTQARKYCFEGRNRASSTWMATKQPGTRSTYLPW